MKIFKRKSKKGSHRLTRSALFYGSMLLLLLGACILSLLQGNWQSALLAVASGVFLLTPFLVEKEMKIYIPTIFSFFISAFLYATIILGQFGNYYAKYWWWDVMLHSGSGLAFGLVGLVVLLVFFKDGKIIAKPIVLCFFAFCFALAIGLVWEIFEFTGDTFFHTDMQHRQTGVVDTMKDIIMDTLGALLAAVTGYLYLQNVVPSPLEEVLDRTVRKNRKKDA
jgi:uncharacterized membrane protein YjdF